VQVILVYIGRGEVNNTSKKRLYEKSIMDGGNNKRKQSKVIL